MNRRVAAVAFALAVAATAGCGHGAVAPGASPSAHAKPHATPTTPPIAVVGSRHGKDPFRLTQLRDGAVRYAPPNQRQGGCT